MQMDKLKLCLVAVVVFTQVASVAGAGLVYTDGNVAQFGCTPQSPVQAPDYYKLTTGGVTVYFPLTHIFCGEINKCGKPTGFHSTAAAQSNAAIPSAYRGTIRGQAFIYNGMEYKPVYGKTFFCSSLTVKGLSNCISKWAAECYNNINYPGDCMYLTNIPNVNNGIQVFFRRGQQGHVINLTTAYPPAKKPGANCKACQIPQPLNNCNLRQ